MKPYFSNLLINIKYKINKNLADLLKRMLIFKLMMKNWENFISLWNKLKDLKLLDIIK